MKRSRTCKKFWRDNIRVVGFARDVENYLSQGTDPRLSLPASKGARKSPTKRRPAACRRSPRAKRVTWWSTASKESLFRRATWIGFAEAILHLYEHPEIVERMSVAARERVVKNFTWDHFRTRLLIAYQRAMRMKR